MGLLTDFEHAKNQKSRCSVKVILANLNDEDRSALLQALDDKKLAATVICAVLRKQNIGIADATLRKHRTGRCSCGSK